MLFYGYIISTWLTTWLCFPNCKVTFLPSSIPCFLGGSHQLQLIFQARWRLSSIFLRDEVSIHIIWNSPVQETFFLLFSFPLFCPCFSSNPSSFPHFFLLPFLPSFPHSFCNHYLYQYGLRDFMFWKKNTLTLLPKSHKW